MITIIIDITVSSTACIIKMCKIKKQNWKLPITHARTLLSAS